jgi:hypothetical protein
MNALKPRAPFQALLMSEVSRLGREQIETAWALKQLSVAGVRCFSYLEDRELLPRAPDGERDGYIPVVSRQLRRGDRTRERDDSGGMTRCCERRRPAM